MAADTVPVEPLTDTFPPVVLSEDVDVSVLPPVVVAFDVSFDDVFSLVFDVLFVFSVLFVFVEDVAITFPL